ncbi:MAG: TonB-dependent receptor, partial [Moraxellaceae bacterium]|nr:TonB-dependent receptor [Moraxellaceae bacterium]
AEVGQRLDNTPRNSLTLWSSWQLTPALSLGGGAQYVDERAVYANNQLPVSVESYWLLNAAAQYQLNTSTRLRLNVYNVTDEEYIFELASGQSIPGAARSASVTAEFSF